MEPAERRPLITRLIVVFLTMFVAQAVGSIFNIWYNLSHIRPLLSEQQLQQFQKSISIYNGLAYPFLVLAWALVVFSLLRHGENEKAQRRVINLPWWATLIGGAGWLCCIPALLIGLRQGNEALDPNIYFHLPVSVGIGAFIALSQGFLAIDLLSQRLLYRYFFTKSEPWRTAGAYPLSLNGRGLALTISAGICPVLALLLLILSPAHGQREDVSFAIAVAVVCILFGISGAWLVGRLVVQPVNELGQAARAVGEGDLEAKVDFLRADEFGVLGDEFNRMVAGLREKNHIMQTFGRHVGSEIARELLSREEELGGVRRTISVLFTDIRGYTSYCSSVKPETAVTVLNLYHACMTETIEKHGGLVNQIVGDGFMAIFGATGQTEDYADRAIAAGQGLLDCIPVLNERLEAMNLRSIEIGVGINTGPAVVGTIGSPRRMEYTAVGDVVNVAARIESLTKELKTPLLFSETTLNAIERKIEGTKTFPPHPIRGLKEPITLCTLASLTADT